MVNLKMLIVNAHVTEQNDYFLDVSYWDKKDRVIVTKRTKLYSKRIQKEIEIIKIASKLQ